MITVIKVRYFIDGVGRNYLPEVSEKVFGSITSAREFYKTKFNSTIINLKLLYSVRNLKLGNFQIRI